MSAEFDRLVAQFEHFQSQLKNVDEQFANLGELQRQVADLEAVAKSPDRSITVVAGPGGSIKDVQFTEDALRQQPQALSSALVATIQEAVAEAARKQASVVDEQFSGMNATDQVLDAQAQLFGTSPEELRERMEQERPTPSRPAEEEYHDDYSEQSILESGQEPRPQQNRPSSQSGGSQGDEFLRNLFD